ncbi:MULTISPECIES: metallo-dependent hydrolase [Clostridium]|uniref:Adenine deaminase n=3 Tax=Clostridium TaxID=1485 RepID=D8GSD8_CLOLD|nr:MULTISPECIES: metallo-dependent hydrolase [Clostridium]ADK16520.1 predicted amidohydrolase [Clostridium ljungdahlii DSM 13528]AGY75601.1 metallo-dependent hydrolase [Clostridium autoethanogenum DSM 10061]ALU35764.1 Amidohydrolase [Clostridium autoethanogenum DSM 10061]OAA89611.1 Adenine deaminase [Clostridium ljungdahlii DSM 13528]OVY52174.1 Adenine deaminase [Clostridium autoethanogenum]
MKYDLIVRNGYLLDPATGNKGKHIVAVKDDKIADYSQDGQAIQTINAKGCYVFPGLIDFHTHIYEGSDFGVSPDLLLANGVTAAVDAGSTGCVNFEMFYKNSMMNSKLKIKAFLNVSSIGQPGAGIDEPLDPKLFQKDLIRSLIRKYKGTILGLKIRFSKNTVGGLGTKPLEETLKLAQELGVPVCVHTTNPPIDAAELVSMLRKGDIYCHIYHGTGSTLLEEDGTIKPAFLDAAKRGVIFDCANGRFNLDYKVAKQSISNKFLPDIISTDTTKVTLNVPAQVKSLPFVMSKYLSFGMSLEDVLKTVTVNPAKLMGMEGKIGTLKKGAYADITICKIVDKKVVFSDSKGATHEGNQLIVPVLTIENGRIAYCQTDFNI